MGGGWWAVGGEGGGHCGASLSLEIQTPTVSKLDRPVAAGVGGDAVHFVRHRWLRVSVEMIGLVGTNNLVRADGRVVGYLLQVRPGAVWERRVPRLSEDGIERFGPRQERPVISRDKVRGNPP